MRVCVRAIVLVSLSMLMAAGVLALFIEHHVNRSLQLRVRDDKRLAVQWAYEVRVCACV